MLNYPISYYFRDLPVSQILILSPVLLLIVLLEKF
jgi:hypothetical protein